MDDYRSIAQSIAEDISAGRLRPGDRLPPQRVFAYQRGIAASTAGRVYIELKKRGRVSGETGLASNQSREPFSRRLASLRCRRSRRRRSDGILEFGFAGKHSTDGPSLEQQRTGLHLLSPMTG
jgi:DNA-binding transcriptional MocR family regulator